MTATPKMPEAGTEIVKEKSLAKLETPDMLQLFTTEGFGPLIEKYERETLVVVADVSTPKGRGAIKSLAADVARAKVRIDNFGKELVADWKAKSKKVDGARKLVRDRLDILKINVRRPVTEWEEAEEAREKAEKLWTETAEAQELAATENELFDMKKKEDARLAEEVIEKAKKEKAEREERIRQEAVEEGQRKAEEETERIERERAEAEKKKKDEAAAAEREEQRKAANKNHQKRIRREAEEALIANSIPAEIAADVIAMIAEGKIAHVSIAY